MAENNSPQWTYEDAAGARQFFESPLGQKFISSLSSSITISDADSFEEEALNYRLLKGGMKMLATINHLVALSPETEPENVIYHNPTTT